MSDWKECVKEAFIEAAPIGASFVDCDIFDQKRRLLVTYQLPGKDANSINIHDGKLIEPFDTDRLKQFAREVGVAIRD